MSSEWMRVKPESSERVGVKDTAGGPASSDR